jgi:hypothetical protein
MFSDTRHTRHLPNDDDTVRASNFSPIHDPPILDEGTIQTNEQNAKRNDTANELKVETVEEDEADGESDFEFEDEDLIVNSIHVDIGPAMNFPDVRPENGLKDIDEGQSRAQIDTGAFVTCTDHGPQGHASWQQRIHCRKTTPSQIAPRDCRL